jgi:cellulose synthase (UDP-forming)
MRTFLLLAWLLAASFVVFLVAQPIDAATQLAIGSGLIAIMLCLQVMGTPGILRQVYLGIGTFIVMRYLYWRVTETIPSPLTQLGDFVPAVLLLGAECYCILMLAISLFVNAKPLDRRPPPVLAPETAPTVDVFVPSYNESPEIVAVTLAAAKAMDYPAGKLTVHLLDDGGTDEKIASPDRRVAAAAAARRQTMQRLCADLGVEYRTRARNVQAKAGNLNAALAGTTGEIVVVFDADHVPAREFLTETVGHFIENARLFLVQTPHCFINPDPIERNLRTYTRMPSENEMFYSGIQKGLDQWNAAFFCGSAALLRRSALVEAGGFAGVSITEDCETALGLHSRGWESIYVDRPMISGLQPESFANFIGQRSRWCRGMLQIFLLQNPLFSKGLSFGQRLCYMSSNIFWLFPISRVIFMTAPLLFIFFNLEIYNASAQEFVAYTLMYMIAGLLMQNKLFGNLRWPWVSEVYEYVQTPYLLKAIFSVVLNPRAPKFNVTTKGETLDQDHVSELAWPFYAIFAVLALATVYAGLRYANEPELRDLILIVGAWNVLNLVLAGIALGVVCERRERRSVQRLPATGPAMLRVDGRSVPVDIRDASIGGIRVVATPGSLEPVMNQPAALVLDTGEGSYEVAVVSRNVKHDADGISLGLRFTGLSPARFRAVSDLAYADIGELVATRARRQVRRSVIGVTAEMIMWALTSTARGLVYGLFRRSGSEPAPAAVPESNRPAATEA